MAKKKNIKKTQKPAKVKQSKQTSALSPTQDSSQTTEPSAPPSVIQTAALDEKEVSAPDHSPHPPAEARETTAYPDQPSLPPIVSGTTATLGNSESIEQQLKPLTLPKSRMRRMLPDLIRVLLALSVITIGTAIWLQPPIFTASFPHATFQYHGKTAQDATLYRPVAMPERYYIELPEKLENRYQWFAVDRRREVVALCEEPQHRFLGKKAIRRGAPLGLDLEFRKLDGSEWLIHFYTDAIVCSNNVLSVRLEIKK